MTAPVLFLALLHPGPASGSGAGEKGKSKASPEAARALRAGAQMLKSNQLEPAIEKLRSVIKGYPRDPAAESARKLLLENGVGDEIRVQLLERDVFRTRFKIQEAEVLELSEKILKELRFRYQGLTPFFEKSQLRLVFYDSQARYREKGGRVSTAGHFGVHDMDPGARSLSGKIEWYYPQKAQTPKDRQTFTRSLLYHEAAHYLNAIHFGGSLPSILNEGLATFFQSRLITDYYQHYRETERERFEGEARNGLNAIARSQDFLRLIDSPWGFGQGDAMVQRWYGFSYAIVDFMSEGAIGARKASFEELLLELGKIIQPRLKTLKEGQSLPPLAMRPLLEQLVQSFYEVKLEDFHRELLKHILSRYKQR